MNTHVEDPNNKNILEIKLILIFSSDSGRRRRTSRFIEMLDCFFKSVSGLIETSEAPWRLPEELHVI